MGYKSLHRTTPILILALGIFLPVRAQGIREDDQQVAPRQFLSRETFLTGAQIGIDVAVALNPETAAVKKAADVTKIVLDEGIKATEFRNSVVESHLLVVNAEAKKLETIKDRDGNLNSPEAQAILGDLRRGHFASGGTGMFLAKSVFSARMAYGVTSHYAKDEFMKAFFGETIAKRLPFGNRAEALWIGKQSFVRTYTNIPWRYLKVLGENSRKLTDALKVVLLKKIGKQLGQYTLENTLDKAVEDILRDHPSIPEATSYYRLSAMMDPRLLMPMAQPALAAMPVPLAAMPAPLVAPQLILTQRDPVVNAATVQHQVMAEQHYHVSTGSSESHHSDPPERNEHPTHNVPTSIHIGGSFTGGVGGTLYTRF